MSQAALKIWMWGLTRDIIQGLFCGLFFSLGNSLSSFLKNTHCCCSVTKSCLTLCNSMDCSQTDSSVHGIFQEEYWSGLPFPPPGGLPNPGIQSESLKSLSLAGWFVPLAPPRKHNSVVSLGKVSECSLCKYVFISLGNRKLLKDYRSCGGEKLGLWRADINNHSWPRLVVALGWVWTTVSPHWNIPLQCVFMVGAKRDSPGRNVFQAEPWASRLMREQQICSPGLFFGSSNVPLETCSGAEVHKQGNESH